MKRFFPLEVFNLENAVAPETFAVKEGQIFYFDRINKYEGRFCKLGNRGEYLETEVDESQGILTHEGEEYLINIDDNSTKVERLSMQGEWQEIINLQGIFFDIRKNETDNYVCLGNLNSVTIIKIFNDKGRVFNDIRPVNIIFGSSIYLQSEHIYLGAVDNHNSFKVLKINYLGSVEASFEVNVNSNNRIIGRMYVYYDNIFMLVEGKQNSLVILDRSDGSLKEIYSDRLGFSNIVDFRIYGDDIYILDGRNISMLKCRDIMELEDGGSSAGIRFNLEFLYYRYHIFSRGLWDQVKFSLLAAALPSVIIYSFLKNRIFQYISGYDSLILSWCLYIITVYFIASIKNIFTMGNKESRIEYLLGSCRKFEPKGRLKVPLFFGITTFAIVEFGMYPDWKLVLPILSLLLTSSLFYGIELLCIKKITEINRDMVVELLEDEDMHTFEFIKKIVNNLKIYRAENFSIQIVLNRKIEMKYLDRWKSTRCYIFGQNVIVKMEDNKIITHMDLSKRDIKYSRFSIIMDYVCFIKSLGGIKEIQVDYSKSITKT